MAATDKSGSPLDPLALVDRLSPETAQGFAEMDEENAAMCRRLLRGVGLDALNDVIDLLRPVATA